jgi:hypothetical protein
LRGWRAGQSRFHFNQRPTISGTRNTGSRSKSGEAVDASIDDTYQRVARALADAEPTAEKQKYWYERFLWALRRGAIPAGRITSNAGALEHKPATSRSTAPSRARSAIRWTASSTRCTRPASR